MKINEIAFTGYPVTDIKRARAFYENVLGLKPTMVFDMDGEMKGKSWVEYDVGANTIAISNVSPDWKPTMNGVCIAFEVADFDAAVATIRKANVPMQGEPMETPGCRMAFITDPDGNPITIHKRKAQ